VQGPSCEETHVGAAHLFVWVARGGQHPLGPGAACSVRAKEVVENSGVQRLDALLVEVVVVCFDLGALSVVRADHHLVHYTRVLLRILAHFGVIVPEVRVRLSSEVPIPLLLLIPQSVLLHNEFGREVHQQALNELASVLCEVLINVESVLLLLSEHVTTLGGLKERNKLILAKVIDLFLKNLCVSAY